MLDMCKYDGVIDFLLSLSLSHCLFCAFLSACQCSKIKKKILHLKLQSVRVCACEVCVDPWEMFRSLYMVCWFVALVSASFFSCVIAHSHWMYFSNCDINSFDDIIIFRRSPMIVMMMWTMMTMAEYMHCRLVMQHLPMNWHVLLPMVIEFHVMLLILLIEYVNYYLLSLYCCHCCCCCYHYHL